MRIRNYGRLEIPRELWRELARAMKLDGILPGALHDELGIYGTCKTLRVTVRPPIPRKPSACPQSYTFGHISIYPCPACTLGFLTSCYLDGLMSAWLHQYHEDLYEQSICGYWDDRPLFTFFTERAYSILGGTINKPPVCGNHRLSVRKARRNVPAFREFAQTLLSCKRVNVPTWHRKAGRRWRKPNQRMQR